ncbi:phospholipase [Pseudomonas sp. ANT_J12]|jgi:1-phosphatidylinositol phosphodiesterase|uniref:phospholipase n=1 Tax=Pseudomonas sp. ANT_J12 TaxID=2597351 RepID=UPI0011F3425F|nr:phospholipase [Pseudomonas sp. ANT_J12]KAA0984723.1 phospholipase [Pseudomonas sp. ANT_J12]
MSNSITRNNYANWMSTTPDIDHLNIGLFVWPGCHNAGMDWDIGHPFPESTTANWALCQNHDLLWQMRNGARSFDLRIMKRNNEFMTFHGSIRGRRLREIIASANTFLDENPDEFIILDFNTLQSEVDNRFDFQAFEKELLQGLKERLIPRHNRHLTFAQLKNASQKQRIILSVAYYQMFYSDLFWPEFENRWQGDTFVSTQDLAKYVVNVMQNPPTSSYPWRLSMTQYTLLRGPTKLTKEINTWFDLDSYLLYRSSIVSVDFFEETKLVEYCIAVNSRLVRDPDLKRPYRLSV